MGLFGNKTPDSIRIGDRQLRCVICDHDEFWKRDAQLNTAVASFFSFDWANPTAKCFVCDGCGHIHWFLTKIQGPG